MPRRKSSSMISGVCPTGYPGCVNGHVVIPNAHLVRIPGLHGTTYPGIKAVGLHRKFTIDGDDYLPTPGYYPQHRKPMDPAEFGSGTLIACTQCDQAVGNTYASYRHINYQWLNVYSWTCPNCGHDNEIEEQI